MRVLWTLLVILFVAAGAEARGKLQGWCTDGGVAVTIPSTQGSGSQRFQRSYPSCTVTVYYAGTTAVASIYADDSGTVKANPFTAASSGQWFFYTNAGKYDVRFSGGGISAPFTLGDQWVLDATNLDDYAVFGARNASRHNWSVTPGGTLTAGLPATVTMTTLGGCPLGVVGTNTTNYLYITGGTGTAEAVLIAGGTCTSGAASGTLTFTPANNHSGAWTLGSASGGIQEAINALTGGVGDVIIPAGTYNVYQTIRITADRVNIRGQGEQATIITFVPPSAGLSVFKFQATTAASIDQCSIAGLGFSSANTTDAKYAIEIVDAVAMDISHIAMTQAGWRGGGTEAIRVRGKENVRIHHSYLVGNPTVHYMVNPNVAGISLDHSSITDSALHGPDPGPTEPCILVDSATYLTQVTFERIAMVGCVGAFEWIDTGATSISEGLSFRDMRAEQCPQALAADCWLVRIEHNYGMNGLTIDRIYGYGSEPDEAASIRANGVKLRNVSDVNLSGLWFTNGLAAAGSPACIDFDSTVARVNNDGVRCNSGTRTDTSTDQFGVYALAGNIGTLVPNSNLLTFNPATKNVLVNQYEGGLTAAGVPITVANDATTCLLGNTVVGVLTVSITTAADGKTGIFDVGLGAAPELIYTSAGPVFTITATNAGTANVYWSAGNACYELENKRGASRTFYVTLKGKGEH